jgi:hypothetical protein
MAAVLCAHAGHTSFVNCTFNDCGIMATGGGTVFVSRCSFTGADVAVCATGAVTAVALTACIMTRCSEALVAEGHACVVADGCRVRECRINGVHAAGQGSVILEKTEIVGSNGFAGWARGEGSAVVFTSCAFRGCVKGTFYVDHGAKCTLEGSCELLG